MPAPIKTIPRIGELGYLSVILQTNDVQSVLTLCSANKYTRKLCADYRDVRSHIVNLIQKEYGTLEDALFDAVEKENTLFVKFLIDNGAKINMRDIWPLLTETSPNLEIAKMLLAKKRLSDTRIEEGIYTLNEIGIGRDLQRYLIGTLPLRNRVNIAAAVGFIDLLKRDLSALTPNMLNEALEATLTSEQINHTKQKKIAKILVQAGADPTNENGLFYLLQVVDWDLIEFMESLGADTRAVRARHRDWEYDLEAFMYENPEYYRRL